MSTQEKEQIFQSIVANVSESAFQIEPVEYGILAQVEVAALLWERERERASGELSRACVRLRELFAERKGPGAAQMNAKTSEAEKRRFRMTILRKIARLNPDLVRDLMVDAAADANKVRPAVVSEATDEGTAIMAVAMEEMQRDPKFAAQLAQQSLSYGVTGAISTYLFFLSRQDKQQAEQEAVIFLTRLRDSSISPIFMRSLRVFVAQPMIDYYLESLAIRIRRGLRPDLNPMEYRELITAAKGGLQDAASNPRWRDEFARLAGEFEALMKSRSLPVSNPRAKTISMAGMSPASPGDTKEISEAALRAEAVISPRNRDLEYQKLAIEAAGKADDRLAEKLLFKINDEELRRKTSISVYSPLVRKALSENEWFQAKTYALKVTDPLGQSLMADSVARAMSKARQDKQAVKAVYDAALTNLNLESPSLVVAKGIIFLAKSLMAAEPENGFAAANMAVSVLNRTDVSQPFSKKSGVTNGLDPWVMQSNPMLGVDDYFDVTETVGPLFKEMSKRDVVQSQAVASGFSHRGLGFLAQLGIAREMLDEIKEANRSDEKGKQAVPDQKERKDQ
ncbi:MAG: hypothetical protein MOB07_20940 [Acidobacteria bacterium]|nr:hypothetical protein [Acidobacteriota bacterium]